MQSIHKEARKTVLGFNLSFTVTLGAVLMFLIPRSFWSTEFIPLTVWVALGLMFAIGIGALIVLTQKNYPAWVGAFIAMSIITLIISNAAPEVAEKLHLIANFRVSNSTLIILWVMFIASMTVWRYIKKWPAG